MPDPQDFESNAFAIRRDQAYDDSYLKTAPFVDDIDPQISPHMEVSLDQFETLLRDISNELGARIERRLHPTLAEQELDGLGSE